MEQGEPLHSGNDKLATVSSAQLLSPREIRKQLLIDRLQDKAVILPFGISAMALIYSLLYAPILGGFLIGLVVFILAGLAGVAVFLWRFVIQYQGHFARKSQELLARYEAENSSRAESLLKKTYADLEQGFYEIKAHQGLKSLRQLQYEYSQLQLVLNRGPEADLLSMSNLALLVRETYLQGLNVLEDTFELERALHSTDNTQLRAEIADLERKAALVQQYTYDPGRIALINEKIESNKERLAMAEKLQLRVDELLHQADRCEASLGKTRIELAALKVDASSTSVSAVIDTLRETIERAKAVQAELKQMGY